MSRKKAEEKEIKVKKTTKKVADKEIVPIKKKETKKKIVKEEKTHKKVIKKIPKKEEVKEEKQEKKVIKKEIIKKEEILLPKKNQKTLKVLSKIIYVITKILRVCAMIVVPIMAVVAILLPIVFSKIEANGNIIKVDDVRIVIKESSVTASIGEKTYLIGENLKNLDKVIDFLNDNSVLKIMIGVELALIFSIILIIINIYLLMYIEKLFKNIHHGKTPFTDENTDYIHKIGRIMIISIIFAMIFEFVLSLYTKNALSIHFASHSIIAILAVYVIYYIFIYATKLQTKFESKIYD